MRKSLYELAETWDEGSYNREFVTNIDLLGRPFTLRLSYTYGLSDDMRFEDQSGGYELRAWFYEGHNTQDSDREVGCVESGSRFTDPVIHAPDQTVSDLRSVFVNLFNRYEEDFPMDEFYATNYEGELGSPG